MGLIREDMTIQDFNVLIQTAAGIQELWDGYSSSVKECHELKEALAEERCARVDTDGRCKGLYESLRKEKETNAELRSKIRLLEASLAQAESAVAGLEKAMAEKDASLERLFKMCFGKKSESLEHVLGKKACRELRAALCPGAGQGGTPHDGETNGACADGSGVAPHGGMEEASGEGTPAPAKGDGNGTSEGAAPGACQDSTGGKPDGKMAGAGKGNGKRGKKDLKRKPGFLDRYCDTSCGAVYSFENINYTEEEILNAILPEGDRPAAYMSSNIEVYKTLEYCPGFYYIKCHIVPTIRKEDGMLRGLRTDRILNGSGASPSVISHFAAMKFRQGLPFNTLSSQAREEGARVMRETIAGWVGACYRKLLFIVHMALLQYIKKCRTIIGDETYAYMKKEGGLHTGYFWGVRTSPLEDGIRQVVFYVFDETRQSAVPLFYLHGFTGNFLSDGYVAYEVFDTKDGGTVRCSCWVHGRRMVVESLPGSRTLDDLTDEAKARLWAWTSLCIISEMFRLEKGWRGLTQEERLERRKEELAPLIGRFFEEARKAEGSSGFDRSCDEGKAVLYFLDREASFRKLLEDGSVPLSTNDIERCNIAIALTRKRAKAFDSTEGADAAAGYFSLISTAEANGVNPEKYLKFLLTVMPSVIYEHRGEIEAYIKYQEEAAQRFKEVKEGRKQNSKAADEIDWNGLKEPGLDFLFPLLPGGEALSAFLELDDGPDRKAILDAMTRKNLEESTVSVETMRRILYTGKNLANESLNGLRDVLAAMPAQSGKSMSSHNPKEEIVKGMHVFKAHYPERLFEICEMRGRHFLQPPSGGGGMEGPLTGTAELTSPPMHTAPCGMPGGCPPPGDATGAA